MEDEFGNKLGTSEHICSLCGKGTLHHTDDEAELCLRRIFSGNIKDKGKGTLI